jgi:hypothetical protein
VEVLDTQVVTVAQELQEGTGVRPARDQQDVTYTGVDEGLDRVVNHGPIEDRQ